MGQEADAAERCTNAVQVVGCSKSRTECGYWAAVILGLPQVGVAGLSDSKAEISLGEAGVRDELLYDRYRATGTGYLWIVQGTKTRHAASGHWLGGGCCELGGPRLGRKRI